MSTSWCFKINFAIVDTILTFCFETLSKCLYYVYGLYLIKFINMIKLIWQQGIKISLFGNTVVIM